MTRNLTQHASLSRSLVRPSYFSSDSPEQWDADGNFEGCFVMLGAAAHQALAGVQQVVKYFWSSSRTVAYRAAVRARQYGAIFQLGLTNLQLFLCFCVALNRAMGTDGTVWSSNEVVRTSFGNHVSAVCSTSNV